MLIQSSSLKADLLIPGEFFFRELLLQLLNGEYQNIFSDKLYFYKLSQNKQIHIVKLLSYNGTM